MIAAPGCGGAMRHASCAGTMIPFRREIHEAEELSVVRVKPGLFYIPTLDIDAAIAWYRDILGVVFEPKFDCGDGTWMAEHHFADHPTPRPFLGLVQGSGVRPVVTTVPVAGLNVSDMDALRQRLADGDVSIEGSSEGGGARWLRFRDLEGNLLEANWWEWDHL
jgi:catechol 2,3-dioxygenase-like lactoylglutathione lyase family enzyme